VHDASGRVELLVDGKMVAVRQERRRDVAVLAAELPDDPPQPFTVRVDLSKEAGEVPVCVMEADGARERLPYAPLADRRASFPNVGTRGRTRGRLRRLVRRRLRPFRGSRR
jgi:hypothetical protein